MKAQVLGLSVDSVPCLKAWADSLGGITYPLLSDFYPHGEVAQAYGVLRSEGYTERAIFVIDRQGVIRYVDVHDIDSQPDNEEIFKVLAELEPEAAEQQAAKATAAVSEQPRPAARVVMYCTSWCPGCRRARTYLEEHGIDYIEIDIGRDPAAAQRVRQWAGGNQTTPTFDVNGTIIVDFHKASQEKLAQVLGIA
jgi:glutaredoxin